MENQLKTSRRITATLFASQSLSSAVFIAMATVLSIVATQLYGNASQAGLPAAIYNLSAAPAAFFWGVLWDRIGRRKGLAFALFFGFVGSILAFVAIQKGSFILFLIALSGLGASKAAMQLGRFIAAEVSPPQQRGQAIAYVVLGGTVGAVLGPLLVGPSGQWMKALNLDELTGPFAIGIVLFIFVVLIAYWGLNPEPLLVSREIETQYPIEDKNSGKSRPIKQLIRLPAVRISVLTMAIAGMVMVMVMGMTSLHMREKQHQLNAISVVFSAHTLGMFAFSILSGRLADRWGRIPVIFGGIILLLASFALAPMNTSTISLAVALFLLGLGWNFCFVGGSAFLADQLTPGERSRMQGTNDVFMALATGVGSYGSGFLYASLGYGLLNLVSAGFVLILLAVILSWIWSRKKKDRDPQPIH